MTNHDWKYEIIDHVQIWIAQWFKMIFFEIIQIWFFDQKNSMFIVSMIKEIET